MLRGIKKSIRFLVCVCVMLAVFSGAAAAHATTTSLPAGMLIGDQDGIQVDEHGYYYIDARGLKPGDVIHKTITIQNLTQASASGENRLPYQLSMTAEPLSTQGPLDLLEETDLIIKLDGTVVYSGSCRGDGDPDMTYQALQLGTYGMGDRRQLDITLTVSPTMKLYEEKSAAEFKWHFYAYRDVELKPPKTGLAGWLDLYGYLLPPLGVLLLFAVLLPLKKRRDAKLQTDVYGHD